MPDPPLLQFAVGEGSAFVSADRIAVTAGDTGSATARVLRSLVVGRRALADVMTELSQVGFEHLDPFVVMVVEADAGEATTARLLHRGDVKVTVERADGTELVFRRPEVATWREEFVGSARAVRAELGDPLPGPLRSWCDGPAEVPAAAVSWIPRPVGVPQPPTVHEIAEERVAETVAPTPEPEPAPASEAAAAGADPPESIPVLDAPPVPDLPVSAGGPPLPVPDLPPPAADRPPAPVTPGEADDIDFANLVHHTVFRRPEDAAVRPGEEAVVAEAPPPSPAPAPAVPPAPVSPPLAADATRVWRDGAGIIDAVPAAGSAPIDPAPAPALPSVAPPAVPGHSDHDGFTVARPRRAPSAGARPAAAARPPVHAVRCPIGHPNPPSAPACRICAAPIADRAARTEPRPQLGVIRFSTGQAAVIDGPLVVGRNPPSGIEIDGEHAAAVAIDDSEISRYHLTVRVAEWSVSVEDLGSTNGTVVRLPGKADQTLRPHERVQIAVGAEVELGGNVTFRYEVG